MTSTATQIDLNTLFLEARTHNAWQPRAVSPDTLRQLYETARWAPTALNAQPARFVFVTTPEGKERLRPALMASNVEKSLAAPVTAIVAWDAEYFERLGELFPAYDARPMFRANAEMAQATAFRNSSLQAAYLMLAARALGLDCGPMSGFDEAVLNAEFFPDGKWKANMLINLGYGEPAGLYPRNPRLSFEDACRIV